jgi:hypothetical protein
MGDRIIGPSMGDRIIGPTRVINNMAQAWVIEPLAQVWVIAAQSWVNQGQKHVATYQWVADPVNNSVFCLVNCASQLGSINHCGSHPVTTKWIILRDESQAQFWRTPTAEYVSYTSGRFILIQEMIVRIFSILLNYT